MLTEARSSPVRVTRLLTDKAACWVPAAVCSVTLAISASPATGFPNPALVVAP